MTNFEIAVLAACKTFVAHYESQNNNVAPLNTVRTPNMAPQSSNGIPICPIHDKAMKDGKYGYFCTAKEDDPQLANKNGYCSYKVK